MEAYAYKIMISFCMTTVLSKHVLKCHHPKVICQLANDKKIIFIWVYTIYTYGY